MENKYSHSIKLVTDVTLLKDNKVLLVKYSDTNIYDHQKGWFIPDDLVQDLEDPDESAKRILKEQLDIEGLNPKVAFVESFIGNDKTWHIFFHYKVEIEDIIQEHCKDTMIQHSHRDL